MTGAVGRGLPEAFGADFDLARCPGHALDGALKVELEPLPKRPQKCPVAPLGPVLRVPLGGACAPLERQRPAARLRRVRRVKPLDERPVEPFGLFIRARVRRVLEQLGKGYVLVFRQRV